MKLEDFSLSGKVAVVIGGSKGIGRAISIGYGDMGASVVVASRNLEECEKVAGEIEERGGKAIAVRCDITKEEDLESLAGEAIKKFGKVDILVNCPARSIMRPLLELRPDGWDKIMDTSLKGYFLSCRVFGGKMKERRSGSIINISSTAGIRISPHLPGYSVAKAALNALTKIFASELGPFGIRVNAIAPGLVKTEFSKALWEREDALKARVERIPLGRIAEPEDIVGAAVFLASDASSLITGHILVIDGGESAGR